MLRRDLFKSIAAAGMLGTIGGRGWAAPSGWRQFEVTYRLT